MNGLKYTLLIALLAVPLILLKACGTTALPNCVGGNCESESVIIDYLTGVSTPANERYTITLRDHREIYLDTTMNNTASRAQLLDSIRQQGRPMYFKIDPTTRVIQDYLFSMEYQVQELRPKVDTVEVLLIVSAAIHVLKRSNPDFQNLLEALEKAKLAGETVLVTETDLQHEIIDVRPPLAPLTP